MYALLKYLNTKKLYRKRIQKKKLTLSEIICCNSYSIAIRFCLRSGKRRGRISSKIFFKASCEPLMMTTKTVMRGI